MAKPLSPAAQAVLDATDEWASYDIPTGTIAAAALRALADHQIPAWDGTGPASHWTPTPHTRSELRNIANELEGRHG